jgi:ferredoxin
MASPTLVRKIINLTFSGRFMLSRLSHYGLAGKVIDYLLFKDDDILYLPRDTTIPIDRDLDRPADMVLPSQVLDRIIDKAAHHWIMDFCICRESSGCRDYPIEMGCLFMGEAAMDINPKFGRPVIAEQAREHVRQCRDAGLVHLVGRNKLDSVWLNVKPAEKLFTVCNCCPCCCFWRLLPDITPDIGSKLTRMPGIELRVTRDCVGCGTCTEDICFVNAIRLQEGKAFIDDTCRGCGRCVDLCPNQAIELVVTHAQFLSHTLGRLTDAVDLS